MAAGQTLKRRGILAAAGATVAGLVAKQAAQPVRAVSDTNYVAMGGSGIAFNIATGGYSTGVSATGTNYGVYSSTAAGFAVYAVTSGSGPSGNAGVYGGAGGSGNYGVHGVGSGSIGTGVRGESTTASGVGVIGEIPATVGIAPPVPNTAANTIAVFGNNLSSGANGIGVYGSCANGTGIYGQTSASYLYGVLGTTYAPTSTAIAGTCTGNGSSAFSGGTGNPNAFAAYFQGHVQIDGPFDVIGAGNKHAAVAHPDGSHRTIYSIEAAEAWVEDFGTGTLTGGKADIKLDVDFAALIETGDYHVFITEHGDHHLHVSQRTGAGFTVEASATLAKAAGVNVAQVSGTFSWRIVARPKTTAKVGRLAKVNLADAKALLPDPAKLPKPQQPLGFPPPTPGTKP